MALGLDEVLTRYIDPRRPSFKWGVHKLFDDADLIVWMSRLNKIFLPLRYHRKFVTLSNTERANTKRASIRF